MVRVFQSMQDTRTAFRLYLVENGINIVLGVLLVGPLGVRGLALSVSIAYTVAALLALSVVRSRVGGLGGRRPHHPGQAGARRLGGDGGGHRAGPQRVRGHVGLRPAGPGGPRRGGRGGRLRGHGRRCSGPGPSDRRRRRGSAAPPAADPPSRPVLARRGPVGRRRPSDRARADPSPEPFRGRLDDQPGDSVPPPAAGERPPDDGSGTDEHPSGDEEEDPMARIRVVTDSACDLSAEHGRRARDLTVVPLSIRFGSEEFVDGSTLSTDEFWARCKASPVLPETSAPSPGAFQEAFVAAADDGYDGVLCINLSAEVSATYQAAVAAAKAVGDRIPVPRRRLALADHGPRPDGPRRSPSWPPPAPPSTSWSPGSSALIATHPGLRRGGHPRAPREGGPHRRGPGPARLAALHQAGGDPASTAWSRRSPSSAPGAARSATWPTRPTTRRRSAGWPCATAPPPTSTSSSACSTA